MVRKRLRRGVQAGALGALLLCSACLGPNHATANLAKWNADFENKWAREGVFLLTLPAYVIFSLGDNLIFNSIYWWTGDNPIGAPEGAGPDDFGL